MFERLWSKDAENFATELVREFSKRYPPDAAGQGAPRTAAFVNAVDDLWMRVTDYQRAKRPGIYGKAGTAISRTPKEFGGSPRQARPRRKSTDYAIRLLASSRQILGRRVARRTSP